MRAEQIPKDFLPDGFSPLVLLRVMDLAERLRDDAIVVIGFPAELPLDMLRTHPKRAREWREQRFNIFHDLSSNQLTDWTLDGAVVIHPCSGEVLDITVKLLQTQSIQVSVAGGFKKDAALKVAAGEGRSVTLCRSGGA